MPLKKMGMKLVSDRTRPTISCFMNIKNGISQGYPFVEAIMSGLDLCEEFVISDGYSIDGTYEVLVKLKKRFPKIKLYKIKWNDSLNSEGEVIAETANQTKKMCHGLYIFYLQANEIIHEASIKPIKSLLDNHPTVEMFHIPFYQILLRNTLFEEGFRIRLCKNLFSIKVLTDGTQLGYKNLSCMPKLKYKGSRRYVSQKNILALSGIDKPNFLHAILPKPIFRYPSLYRANYAIKLEGHMGIYKKKYTEYFKKLKNMNSRLIYDNSFKNSWIYETYKTLSFKSPSYMKNGRKITLADHPSIIQNLLIKKNKKYEVPNL